MDDSKSKVLQSLLDTVGAIAELSVHYYRSAINAGATPQEARELLYTFQDVMIHGKRGTP